MCDPISITAAAVSTAANVGGRVMEYNAQKKAAKDNKANAMQAFVENVRALNLRQTQEAASASDSIQQAQGQSAAEKGMATVGSLDAGVAGNSVTAQAQQLDRGLATYRDSTLLNLDRITQQIDAEKQGAATAAQGRINQMPKPSGAALALGITSDVAQAAGDLYTRRKPTPGGK